MFETLESIPGTETLYASPHAHAPCNYYRQNTTPNVRIVLVGSLPCCVNVIEPTSKLSCIVNVIVMFDELLFLLSYS